MDRRIETFTPLSLFRRRERIDTNPDYQRPAVWSKEKKQWLMDSIIRDMDIPKIYLHRTRRNPDYYQVIDGQQRLRAIWEFYDGGYSLPKESKPVNGQKVAGLKFNELPSDLTEMFDGYQLTVVVIDSDDEIEIRDMFVRLQRGEKLTPAEVRHATSGAMRDLCVELARHPFFKSCAFANKRFAHEQLAAQMFVLEETGSATTVSSKVLDQKYADYRGIDFHNGDGAAKVKRTKRILSFLARAFPEKTPDLTRYTVQSLYLLVSQLHRNHPISGIETEFRTWFFDFMTRLVQNRGLPPEEQDPTLVNFQIASDLAKYIHTRHEILSRDFFLHFRNLPTLDNQRFFSPQQRLAIYRLSDGCCEWVDENNEVCGQKLNPDDWHADHVEPWSIGGKTVVSNGRVLCSYRNQQLGNVNSVELFSCPYRDGQ